MRPVGIIVVAAAMLLAAGHRASAQLPTAAGRQFTLSNSAWKLFIPDNYYQRTARGRAISDILVNFHGSDQVVWNNAKYANLNAMIVTVNHGSGSSSYETPFANSAVFQSLLNEARDKARQQADIPDSLEWGHLAVSSFSAGYGAVRQILKTASYRDQIGSLLAADSLYARTAGDGTPDDGQMADYKSFATAAKNGTKTFLFTHSQVTTPYESTRECGDELLQHLGISTSPSSANGLGTLNFYRYAQSGNFKLWGATGNDADAHLEHLRYMGEFLEDLPLARAPIPGDYNFDGKVNTPDYVVWRQSLGSSTALHANGATTGASALVIDHADYDVWRTKYGNSVAAGSASGASVPEPGTLLFLVVAAIMCLAHSRLIRSRP